MKHAIICAATITVATMANAEIKGAGRNRQVPIGKFFLSRLSNEDLA